MRCSKFHRKLGTPHHKISGNYFRTLKNVDLRRLTSEGYRSVAVYLMSKSTRIGRWSDGRQKFERASRTGVV